MEKGYRFQGSLLSFYSNIPAKGNYVCLINKNGQRGHDGPTVYR